MQILLIHHLPVLYDRFSQLPDFFRVLSCIKWLTAKHRC